MKIKAPDMWHVYGGILPEGHSLAGCWVTVTFKPATPQEMPKVWDYGGNDFGGDDFGSHIRHPLPHLHSFDHEPSEEEMEILKEAAGWKDDDEDQAENETKEEGA